ncbi:N-6 DNA Methylase (fragment) [Rhodococcus sp. RD6.2]
MSAITASSGVAAPSQQRCSCRWGGRPFDDLRWSKFKYKHPDEMFAIVDQQVFPFIKNMRGEESTYAHFMKDARLTIPSAGMYVWLPGGAPEYMRANHADAINAGAGKQQYHHEMFHGFDFDNTMLRIGSLNMLLHGIEQPDIRYRDSLAEANTVDAEAYSPILVNPPFAGSLDYENTAKDSQQIAKTKKTELLFLALFLRLLKPGGRAAVIVPDGVLFG